MFYGTLWGRMTVTDGLQRSQRMTVIVQFAIVAERRLIGVALQINQVTRKSRLDNPEENKIAEQQQQLYVLQSGAPALGSSTPYTSLDLY